MSIGWNFPPTNGGQRQGINETGIAIFKGDPIKSLAREICQNSLDAGLENKVVRIEFEKFTTKLETFPDFDNFTKIIDRCLMTSNEEKNAKAINFFKKAQKVLRDHELSFLRISDFNTKGLTNSDSQIKSDWLDLVKKSGSSNKGDSMGGSFGIGKSAPFVCSDLQTVFYSTLDMDGKIASQGVSRLISHKSDNDTSDFTQGVGYYGQIEGLLHIKDFIPIQRGYKRLESGTDIFIAGFSDYDNWDIELIKEILDGYLYALFSGSLEIKINNLLLNQETLNEVVNEYRTAIPQKTLAYYDVLTSPKTHWVEKDFMSSGNVKLGLLINQNSNLPRKVAMIRNPWMKIKDQEDISSISFMGMLIIESPKLNEFLRKIENPSHTNWEPNRAASKDEIELSRRLLKGLKKFIQEEINQIITNDGVQAIDIEGAGEFLPYEEEQGTDPMKDTDSLSPKPKNIEIKKIDRIQYNQKGKENLSRQEFFELVKGGVIEGDSDTFVNDYWGSEHNLENTKELGDKGKKISDGDNQIPSPKIVTPLDVRLISVDKNQGLYKVVFTSSTNTSECSLILNSLDEQGNKTPVELLEARFSNNLLQIKLNRVSKFSMKQGELISIELKTRIKNYFSAEVIINGIED